MLFAFDRLVAGGPYRRCHSATFADQRAVNIETDERDHLDTVLIFARHRGRNDDFAGQLRGEITVTTDLPDLDEAISFAVDDGAQAGPFTMNQIIDSVRSGERAPNTLVWWAGQPDWVAFDAVPELLAQVEVAEEPAPEGDMADPSADASSDSVDSSGLDDAAAAAAATMAPTGDPADPFADVEDYVFSDQPDAVSEPAATITESLDAESVGDEMADTALADTALADTALADTALADTAFADNVPGEAELINADLIGDDASEAEVEVEAESEGWGVAADDDHVDVVEDLAADLADDDTVDDAVAEDLVDDTLADDAVAVSDDADVEDGSFGAPVGELADEFGGSGLFGDGPTEAVADETTSSLQSVSERIEALGSEAPAAAIGGLFGSMRRPIGEDDTPADEVVEDVDQLVDLGETGLGDAAEPAYADPSFAEPEFEEPTFEEPEFEGQETIDSDSIELSEEDGFAELDQIVDEIDSTDDDGLDGDTDEYTPAGDAIAEGVSLAESNPELEALFAEMVEKSGSRHQRFDWASKLDDVSVGAIIASTLGKGFSLVDLHSLGQSHQARFEHPESGERLIVELDSLGPAAAGGELLSQHAYVTVGLGRPVSGDDLVGDDFAADTPGTITVEMDMETGYAFSTVDLIWEFNELMGEDRSNRCRCGQSTSRCCRACLAELLERTVRPAVAGYQRVPLSMSEMMFAWGQGSENR